MANETKTATHTPGPWGLALHDPQAVMAADGIVVVNIDGDGDEEDLANARLIAAAPELLEALIGVHSFEFPTTRPDSLCWCPPKWHDYPAGQQPPHSAQCQEAKDAIAKATGARA